MKNHIYRTAILILILTNIACESHLINGDLDGFWQVQTVEHLKTEEVVHHDNDAFYSSTEWKRKRAAILARDNYQCQICRRYGKLKQATEVHHKKHLDAFPELSLDNDNLISLCHACHSKQHPEKHHSMNDTKWKRRYDP